MDGYARLVLGVLFVNCLLGRVGWKRTALIRAAFVLRCTRIYVCGRSRKLLSLRRYLVHTHNRCCLVSWLVHTGQHTRILDPPWSSCRHHTWTHAHGGYSVGDIYIYLVIATAVEANRYRYVVCPLICGRNMGGPLVGLWGP